MRNLKPSSLPSLQRLPNMFSRSPTERRHGAHWQRPCAALVWDEFSHATPQNTHHLSASATTLTRHWQQGRRRFHGLHHHHIYHDPRPCMHSTETRTNKACRQSRQVRRRAAKSNGPGTLQTVSGQKAVVLDHMPCPQLLAGQVAAGKDLH